MRVAWRRQTVRCGWWRRDRQYRATRREIVGAASRREQAEVADADEAFREDVQQEAPEEFVDVERQRADLAPVPIVLPPKRDRVVRDGDEPVIGDGDAVGVAREVVQHVGAGCQRAASRRPPTAGDTVIGATRERRARGRAPARRPETRAALRESLAQPGDEFPAKDLSQHLHRRKKVGRAWIHRVPSGASPPAGTTQWTWG